MKKMTTATLALGLSALALGAHAQTFPSQTITGVNTAGATIFTVLITPTVSNAYDYSYLAQLKTDPGAVKVDAFSFDFDRSIPISYVSSPGFLLNPTVVNNIFNFTATGGGLVTVGDQTTFLFHSPIPPNGTVGVTSNSATGGGGHASIGPAVPEASTYALLGLGLLPLAFVARRRATNS